MGDKFTQKDHFLELETPLGKDELVLTKFFGTESISKPFCFSLEMFSKKASIAPKQLIGKPVSVKINDTSGKPRYFHGIINRFYSDLGKNHDRFCYRAEIIPWFWFLTKCSDCRIFQDKSTQDIITELFKAFGFSDYSMKGLNAGKTPRSYCVQYCESSFDFISRLMGEEGIYYYFTHEKDKHLLVLADSNSTFKSCLDKEVAYTSSSNIKNCITHWEHQYSFEVGKETRTFYDFEKAGTKTVKTDSTSVDVPLMKQYELYEYSNISDPKKPIDNITKLGIEAHDAQYEIIRGRSDYPNFASGTKFKGSNGSYILLDIKHYASSESYVSGDAAARSYYNEFICIPDTVTYRPLQLTKKPKIYGLQTAMVVGPQGEEVFTDKYGRVKVQFHWDRQGKKDDKSSCWIRVIQPLAGKQCGGMFIPRVGQEVTVSFIDGDPDQPIIVGSVYNSEQMPPYTLPANNLKTGIKTHSSKDGSASEANELYFEDKKGNELVHFHAQKDVTQVIENDSSSEIKGNQTLKITKDRKISVLEGNENIAIEKGNYVLEIKSGDSTQKIKGNNNITVESGNRTESIEKGNRSIKIQTGNDNLSINQGNHATKLNMGKYSIEAMQGIELKVGQNSIKIDQTGIVLNGIKIGITGTLVEIKANASLKLQGIITEVNSSGLLKIQGTLTMIN